MERAILWAMNLHPDERPTSMAQLRDFFTGNSEYLEKATPVEIKISQILSFPEVKLLLYISAGLTAIGLIGALFA